MRLLLSGLFAFSALAVLAGCNSGSSAVPVLPTPSPTATVSALPAATPLPVPTFNFAKSGSATFNVIVPNPIAAVTKISVGITPLEGNGSPSTQTGSCQSTGCSISVAAPEGFNQFTFTLQDVSGNALATGSMRAPILLSVSPAIGISFNGTVASVAIDMDPKTVTVGTSKTVTLSLVLKDSKGNRVIGTTAFANPIKVSGSDNGSAVALSSASFANPQSTITGQYNGSSIMSLQFTPSGTGLARIRHAASVNGASTLHVARANEQVMIGGKTQRLDGSIYDDDELLVELADEDVQGPHAIVRRATATLPAVVDLSTQFPPVGSQGRLGSCTAWSSTYAIYSYVAGQKLASWSFLSNGSPNFSHIMSPAYTYNTTNGGVDNGGSMFTVASALQANGASTWGTMPYSDTDFLTQPSAAARAEAAGFQFIADIVTINAGDTATAKSALAAGMPIFWATDTDDSFANLASGAIWSGPSTPGGGHAMAIIGYDDTLQAFKIMNSWDTTWATNGFGYISYTAWANNQGSESYYFLLK